MNKNKSWTWIVLIILLAAGCWFIISRRHHNVKEDQVKGVRNNWQNYIQVQKEKYTYNTLGGIDAFDIPVENKSDYALNEATLEVSYIRANGDVYKKETISIENIPPNSIKTGQAPGSERGTSVQVKLLKIHSNTMHFCYPAANADSTDPFLCR